MAIDEFTAVLRAREFVRKVNPAIIPVAVEKYADEVTAVIRPEADLGPDEAGYSFQAKEKYFICTNANNSLERQRFTICHEVAHIKLKIPSQHQALPWWSYAKRPLAEILCERLCGGAAPSLRSLQAGSRKVIRQSPGHRKSCGSL